MDRRAFPEPRWQSAEDQAQALRRAKDAVDRSAWFLAMLRKDLSLVPGAGPIRRWHMRALLARLQNQRDSLSSAYCGMAATPPGEFLGMQAKAFFAAYNRFLDAVRAARADSRLDYETPSGACSTDPFQIRCGLPADAAHAETGDPVPLEKRA